MNVNDRNSDVSDECVYIVFDFFLDDDSMIIVFCFTLFSFKNYKKNCGFRRKISPKVQIFDEIDQDKSGNIDKSEFRDMLRRLGLHYRSVSRWKCLQ